MEKESEKDLKDKQAELNTLVAKYRVLQSNLNTIAKDILSVQGVINYLKSKNGKGAEDDNKSRDV